MKNRIPISKPILITHVVNPHQFYFKYTNGIVNSEFSKFDFEIQLYGNELYAEKTYENGYLPAVNELVIFFNVIFNKWIRGRVVSIGQEITFWCIDSGICEKCPAPHVLPLTKRFHEVCVFVHCLFLLENHKFGLLAIESKSANRKQINDILLAMNHAAHSHQYSDEDLWGYVHEARLETQLYKSIMNRSSMQPVMSRLSIKSDSDRSSVDKLMPHEDFDDSVSRQSSSDFFTVQESEVKPSAAASIKQRNGSQSEAEICENPNAIVSNSTAENLNGNCYDNFVDSSSSAIAGPSSLIQNCSNFVDDECHLRSFKRNFTENVRQKPLASTMDWINSMSKLNLMESTSRSNESHEHDDENPTHQTSPALSTDNVSISSTTSRKSMLATLAQKESTLKSTKIVNIPNHRFGVPAGYAKNSRDTFGGLNKR